MQPCFNKRCPIGFKGFPQSFLFRVISYREVLVLVVFLELMAELVSWYVVHYSLPGREYGASFGGFVLRFSILPSPFC